LVAAPGRVLLPGRQARRRRGCDRPGQGGPARGARRPRPDPGRHRARRRRAGARGRPRGPGDPAAGRRGRPARSGGGQGGVGRDAARRGDRGGADRAGPPHRLPLGVHPRKHREAADRRRDQAQPPRRADRRGDQPRAGQDGAGLRRRLRRAGLDPGMVRAGGDPAGREHRDRQPPPPPRSGGGVRRRHHVLLGRAAVPRARQVDHSAGDERPLRRPGAVHLHPRVRPALDLRHEGARADRPGGPLRAGRPAGQYDRPADLPARDRYPWGDPGQLRPVRPRGQSADPPGSGIWAGSPSAGTTPRRPPPPATPTPGRCSGSD